MWEWGLFSSFDRDRYLRSLSVDKFHVCPANTACIGPNDNLRFERATGSKVRNDRAGIFMHWVRRHC